MFVYLAVCSYGAYDGGDNVEGVFVDQDKALEWLEGEPTYVPLDVKDDSGRIGYFETVGQGYRFPLFQVWKMEVK